MARQTNAPKLVTWIISLVLFVVAILAHSGMIHVSTDIATWSWIIGYALLLVAFLRELAATSASDIRRR